MTAARAVAGATPAALTASVEDYLKVVYELEANGGVAGNKEIALALGIAPPSVTGMMRRLAEQGLISSEPYKGVRLSDQGRAAALRTIRRHRIIESYLVLKLGFPWDRVHEEAERLEHTASDELIDRMADALGDPDTDPHGAPIPTREGRIVNRPVIALAALPPDSPAVVARVPDKDAERLRYLAELGIRPGVEVCVVSQAPFSGPITVRVAETERVIADALARYIWVERRG